MTDSRKSARPAVLPWLAVTILIAALMTTYRYLDEVARSTSEPLVLVAMEEFTGVGAAAFLLYWIVPLLRRGPYRGAVLLPQVVAHGLTLLTYSLCHTTLNWSSRSALSPLLGLGAYDYGNVPVRYLMEFPVDVMSYAIAVVLVGFVDRERRAQERDLQLARLSEQLQTARLEGLQAQLRPHFLFNALNTVSSVMYQDVDKADGILQSLSDLLRRMIDDRDRTLVPLSEEVDLLQDYAEIIQARFGASLSMTVRVEDWESSGLGTGERHPPRSTNKTDEWPVPPLILQPLVENSVRHGRIGNGEILTIDIGIFRTSADRLRIEISDNGPGLDRPETEALDLGVGLSATKERLATLYGENHIFALENRASGGLLVTLEIPWVPIAS